MKATHLGLSKFAERIISKNWSSKLKIQNFRNLLLNKLVAHSEEGQRIVALTDITLIK